MNITIFDCLSNTSIGQDLRKAFIELEVNVQYLNARKLPKKTIYQVSKNIIKKRLNIPRLKTSVLKTFIQTDPEIFLVIFSCAEYVDPKILIALKQQTGCQLVLYDTDSGMFFNDRTYFGNFIERELPCYDLVLSCSKSMSCYFEQLGIANVQYFPFGGVELDFQGYKQNKSNDILFVGNPCARRMFYLESLSSSEIAVYGHRWEKNKALLSPQLASKIKPENLYGGKLHDAIARSKIVLNINHGEWKAIESGINLRFFETLSLGAFLLTDYFEELNELFVIGKDIEVFRSNEELIDKTKYYIAHDVEREKIAKQGYEKFIQGFTWKKRLNYFFNLINK